MYKLSKYQNITIVRDDILLGGTKLRYLEPLFAAAKAKGTRFITYAGSTFGASQVAMTVAGQRTGLPVYVYLPWRKEPLARTRQALSLGATIRFVKPGYASNVTAKARAAAQGGGLFVQLGTPAPKDLLDAVRTGVGSVAAAIWEKRGPFDEVWLACGGGLIGRGLIEGLGDKPTYNFVQVGKALDTSFDFPKLDMKLKIWKAPVPFEKEVKNTAPFPSCGYYDAKAWELLLQNNTNRRVLFWNVAGPPENE